MKKLLMLFLVMPFMIFSQVISSDEFLWDKNRSLQKEDYKLIVNDNNVPIKSSITFSYHLKGFNVFNNNFNKNIINKFSGNSSLINPNYKNTSALLEYQQINFDLSEVYARKMRREILMNKSKLWKGFDFAYEIFNSITSGFMKVQAEMNNDTNYGNNTEKIPFWKQKISKELDELSEFDYNNTSKIKIKQSSKEEI